MPNPDQTAMTSDLRRVVAEICAYEPDEIEGSALLFDDLGLDSISLLDVLATMSQSHPQLVGLAPQELEIDESTTYDALERLMLGIVSEPATEGALE